AELGQGLRVLALDQDEPAAEVRPRPAAQQLDPLRRLALRLLEPGDPVRPPLRARLPAERDHELHRAILVRKYRRPRGGDVPPRPPRRRCLSYAPLPPL